MMKTVVIDVNQPNEPMTIIPLKFGGKNPAGVELSSNNWYFTRDGKPWFPIMGEIHYSRYPKAYWEESILKMQAGGIGILASYVFWIHHEEIEGAIKWDGNRDLRCFVELCAKHDYPFFLRIGPWCHGECRNGGFPDWLLQKEFEPRTNDDRYFAYVQRWYEAIYDQIKGLLYKDGGPIIGIQIENEYGHCGGLQGEEGKRHMLTLKRMAQEIGFDVPFYTATGWGGAVVVENEMMPVMGAYASLPWTQHTDPLPPSPHYLFSEIRDDFLIGADLATQNAMLTYTPEKYPFALAELGPGNQCTYHRRPRLSAQDVEAMVLVKLGSGANLIGYYMYHGGSHPVGKLSTMQESKATGYLNDLPVISYDFQAPIREYGQITDKYKALKVLHLFLHDFGEQLALMSVTLSPDNPTDPADAETLRYAVRDHNGSGFLFVNNHQRHIDMTKKSACQFTIHSGGQTVEFPEFSLVSGRSVIFPYNFPLGDLMLQSATVQPFCQISSEESQYYFFFSYPELQPRYVFAKAGIQGIQGEKVTITDSDDCYTAGVNYMGTESVITLQSQEGNAVHCVTLTRKQAEHAWKTNLWGRERLIISSADVTWADDELNLCVTGQETISFSLFPAIDGGLEMDGKPLPGKQDGFFTSYTLNVPRQEIPVSITALPDTADGARQWEIHVPTDAMQELYDIFLHIVFEGDVGQLFLDDALVANWFYDGRVWEIGLKRFAERLRAQPFRLRISPLTTAHTVYLETSPNYDEHGVALTLKSVTAVPQYRVSIHSG